MTTQDDEEKANMRIMWIASGLVVLGVDSIDLNFVTQRGPVVASPRLEVNLGWLCVEQAD